MSPTRRQYPPLPGECFASFGWQIQRADGDRYVCHISVLDHRSRVMLTKSTWEFVSTTLTATALEVAFKRAETHLSAYMRDVFDHQLELF